MARKNGDTKGNADGVRNEKRNKQNFRREAKQAARRRGEVRRWKQGQVNKVA